MPDLSNKFPSFEREREVCVCGCVTHLWIPTYLNPPVDKHVDTDSDEYTKFRCERDTYFGVIKSTCK